MFKTNVCLLSLVRIKAVLPEAIANAVGADVVHEAALEPAVWVIRVL